MNRKQVIVVTIGVMIILGSGINQSVYDNYANQEIPKYIRRDNTPTYNLMNDTIASLGRVLFYDKVLSVNRSTSCSSCHKQQFAFGDDAVVSIGQNGKLTERHSMRLVNIRFGRSTRFFWDQRALSLESQTTQPITNHIEMGFSGLDGSPSLEDLLLRLSETDIYPILFKEAFGDKLITEDRVQLALAQFIRSIQSFDSKYDEGLALVGDIQALFPNFTDQENEGKRLFMKSQGENGADCQNCHRAPLFDIDPDAGNNGLISVAGRPNLIDMSNIRSPTLRDLVNERGDPNGPFMHDGSLTTLMSVIEHYNKIPTDRRNSMGLDSRLEVDKEGTGETLDLRQSDKEALVAFLRTLSGAAIYTDKRWSDPFDACGELIHN